MDRNAARPTIISRTLGIWATVIEYRHHDGANQLADEAGGTAVPYSDYTFYRPVNQAKNIDPDRWQPITFEKKGGGTVTPGSLTPQWYRVKTFGLESSAQFRPGPPSLVGSEQLKKETQKIKGWGGPGKGTVELMGDDWRPYSPSTFITPPFPGFPSGHSTVSGASARMLALITGSDNFGVVEKRPCCALTEPTPGDEVTLDLPTFTATAERSGSGIALKVGRGWGRGGSRVGIHCIYTLYTDC